MMSIFSIRFDNRAITDYSSNRQKNKTDDVWVRNSPRQIFITILNVIECSWLLQCVQAACKYQTNINYHKSVAYVSSKKSVTFTCEDTER